MSSQPDLGAPAAAASLAECSAAGQAAGLGTAGGAIMTESISKSLCPMTRLWGQGRMPRSPQEGVQGLGRVGAGPWCSCEDISAVTPGVAGLQGSLVGWGHRVSSPFPSAGAAPRAGPCAGALPQGRAAPARQRGCAAAAAGAGTSGGEGAQRDGEPGTSGRGHPSICAPTQQHCTNVNDPPTLLPVPHTLTPHSTACTPIPSHTPHCMCVHSWVCLKHPPRLSCAPPRKRAGYSR